MTTLSTTVGLGVDDLAVEVRDSIASQPAQQQPTREDREARGETFAILCATAPLVSEDQILGLRARLADVADGTAVVLQAGDCAEKDCACGEDCAEVTELAMPRSLAWRF